MQEVEHEHVLEEAKNNPKLIDCFIDSINITGRDIVENTKACIENTTDDGKHELEVVKVGFDETILFFNSMGVKPEDCLEFGSGVVGTILDTICFLAVIA